MTDPVLRTEIENFHCPMHRQGKCLTYHRHIYALDKICAMSLKEKSQLVTLSLFTADETSHFVRVVNMSGTNASVHQVHGIIIIFLILFDSLLVALLLPSGATYLVTMACVCVCVYVCISHMDPTSCQ